MTTKVMTGAMVETLIDEKLTKQADDKAMSSSPGTDLKGTTANGDAMSSRDDEHFAAIRRRAYEISEQPDSGSLGENWARAERELTRGSSLQTEGERAPGTHEPPER